MRVDLLARYRRSPQPYREVTSDELLQFQNVLPVPFSQLFADLRINWWRLGEDTAVDKLAESFGCRWGDLTDYGKRSIHESDSEAGELALGDSRRIVFPGDVRSKSVVHSEEAEDAVHHADGVVTQILVEPDPYLLPPEHLKVALELRVVVPPISVVELIMPVVPNAVIFFSKCLGEVGEGFSTDPDGVQEGRVCPVGGVAQEGNQLRLRHVSLDAFGGPGGVDIQDRRLADGLLTRDPPKQRAVFPDVRELDVRGHRPTKLLPHDLASRVNLVIEEERLFDRAHVDLRVLLQVGVERGRPRFLRAYQEEVGHCHVTTSPEHSMQGPLPFRSRLGQDRCRARVPSFSGCVKGSMLIPFSSR